MKRNLSRLRSLVNFFFSTQPSSETIIEICTLGSEKQFRMPFHHTTANTWTCLRSQPTSYWSISHYHYDDTRFGQGGLFIMMETNTNRFTQFLWLQFLGLTYLEVQVFWTLPHIHRFITFLLTNLGSRKIRRKMTIFCVKNRAV